MGCLLVYGWDGLPVFDDEVQDDPDECDEEDHPQAPHVTSIVVGHGLLLMALQMFSVLRLMAVAMMRAPMMIADWVVMGLLLFDTLDYGILYHTCKQKFEIYFWATKNPAEAGRSEIKRN
jgi:hypothetical protein